MSFGSLPRSVARSPEDECGETYTEYDGREGAFQARCTRPKKHDGYHGWGSPGEWRAWEWREYERRS